MTLAFLMCTEPGALEAESQLLASSIRKFGGAASGAAIFSFQPRDTMPLKASTLRAFSALDVAHLRIRLNTRYNHYPIANKALSAAWAERHLEFDNLVMLDSDKLILREPTLLELVENPIALRPVHQKLAGTTGSDSNAKVWQELYRKWGLAPRFQVRTTIHDEQIWGYWNSGLVAAKRNTGFFARWLHYLCSVLEEDLLGGPAQYFADQFALAAAVDECRIPVTILPRSYNYPIASHREARPEQRLSAMADAVTVHYHKMFYQPSLRHPVSALAPWSDSPATDWLIEELHRTGVYSQGILASSARMSRRLLWSASTQLRALRR